MNRLLYLIETTATVAVFEVFSATSADFRMDVSNCPVSAVSSARSTPTTPDELAIRLLSELVEDLVHHRALLGAYLVAVRRQIPAKLHNQGLEFARRDGVIEEQS